MAMTNAEWRAKAEGLADELLLLEADRATLASERTDHDEALEAFHAQIVAARDAWKTRRRQLRLAIEAREVEVALLTVEVDTREFRP